MTSKLLIDIETRSRCDLRRHGVYRYAIDPSTELLLLGYSIDDGPPRVVDIHHGEPIPREFKEAWGDPDVELVAFNAAFERLVLGQVFKPFAGVEARTPIERWRCLAHHSRAYGAPGQLDRTMRFFGAPIEKDMAGHRIMLRLSKPDSRGQYPEADPEAWQRFVAYCAQDVDAEWLLDELLPPLPEHELEMYHLTERLNDRGVVVDPELIEQTLEEHEAEYDEACARFRQLTGFGLTQMGELKAWLEDQLRIQLPDTRKETLTELLESDIPDDVREVIGLRLSFGKAATKKFQAAKDRACMLPSGRWIVPGLFVTHAAVTGRFSSWGLQIHNLVRKSAKPEEVEAWLRGTGPRPPFSHLVRSMVIARPQHSLVISDYSAVEARGVAWLAGEQRLLEAFTSGEDVYCTAWEQMTGEKINKHEHEDTRFIAKGLILGCGYMGGVGAMRRTLREKSKLYTDDQLRGWVQLYRTSYPSIPLMWRQLEASLWDAFTTPGQVVEYRSDTTRAKVGFYYDGQDMTIILPSGRLLHYLYIEVDEQTGSLMYRRPNRWPKAGETRWPMSPLGGPALVENITQAICADLLRGAIRACEAHPIFTLRLHVHDEVVAEVPDYAKDGAGDRLIQEVMLAPLQVPWAADFPLAAEAKISKRYMK